MSELNNFTRLFKNVKNCKELNWQEKALLSEIISYQLDDKSFKQKDKTLSIELGMDKGSISKYINQLYRRGVIDKTTISFASHSGGKPKRQRTITVIEMDKWTKGNTIPVLKGKELDKMEQDNALPIVKEKAPSIPKKIKESDLSLEEMLVNVELKEMEAATSANSNLNEAPSKSDVSTDFITLDNEKDIDNTASKGKVLIAQIKRGKAIEFINVNVKFENDLLPDEAILLTDGSNKYLLKSFLKLIEPSVFELEAV